MTTHYEDIFTPYVTDEKWLYDYNYGTDSKEWSFACARCKHLVGWIHHLPNDEYTFSPFWVLDEDTSIFWCVPCKNNYQGDIK